MALKAEKIELARPINLLQEEEAKEAYEKEREKVGFSDALSAALGYMKHSVDPQSDTNLGKHNQGLNPQTVIDSREGPQEFKNSKLPINRRTTWPFV